MRFLIEEVLKLMVMQEKKNKKGNGSERFSRRTVTSN